MLRDTHSEHVVNNNGSPKRHTIIMLICCLAPLSFILALSSLGIIGSWGFFALILLCPVVHLLLMRTMNNSEHRESERNGK